MPLATAIKLVRSIDQSDDSTKVLANVREVADDCEDIVVALRSLLKGRPKRRCWTFVSFNHVQFKCPDFRAKQNKARNDVYMSACTERLVLRAELGKYGKNIRALIDSGATSKFVDSSLVEGMRLKKDETTMRLGDGSVRSADGRLKRTSVQIGDGVMVIDALFMPISNKQYKIENC